MELIPMYPAIPNSPITQLTNGITDTDTEITVDNISVIPPAPNLLVLGYDESAETIVYTQIEGNTIKGITRGVDGTVKVWDVGTYVARNFTAYDHNTFKANLEAIYEDMKDGKSIPLDTNYSPITSIPNGSKGLFSPEAFGNTQTAIFNSACEDTAEWINTNATTSLDDNHVIGTKSIKVSSNGTAGSEHYISKGSINIKPDSHYFLSGYMRAIVDSTWLRIILDGSGGIEGDIPGPYKQSTTLEREALKFKTNPTSEKVAIRLMISDTATAEGLFDGIMLTEITADEYNNLTEQQLLEKYHYIDGIQSTTSFDIMTRTKNIFNKYNVGVSNYAIVNYLNNGVRIKSTSDGAWRNAKFKVRVKRNCDYYFKADSNVMSGASFITIEGENEEVLGYAGAFNTKDNDTITVLLFCTKETVTNGEVEYTNIQLTEGTTAPTEYIPYEESIAEVRLPEEYPLAKLPNGVVNTVDKDGNLRCNVIKDGAIIKNLTGWNRWNELTNTVKFQIDLSSTNMKFPTSTYKLGGIYLKIGDKIFPTRPWAPNIDSVDAEMVALHSDSNIGIRIEKSQFPDSASFEAYLQANEVECCYELADDHKRIIPNGHEGFSFPTSIQTWENGDLVVIPKKEVVLDGKANFTFHQQFKGYKTIKLPLIKSDTSNRKLYDHTLTRIKETQGSSYITGGKQVSFDNEYMVLGVDNNDSKWVDGTAPTVQQIKDYFNANPYILRYEVDPAYFTYPKITGNIPANLGTRSKMLEDGLSATNKKMATMQDQLDLLIVLNS